MDIIESNFQTSVRDVHNLNFKPSDEELLKIYGLYKQALFGDNTVDKPGFFNFRDRKKWGSWMDEKGKTKIEVMIEYTNYINMLKRKYN